MAVNVRFIYRFLDRVLKKNPEDGIILSEVAKLYDELNIRRASQDKAQPVSFYPLIEFYCLTLDSEARVEQYGSARRIRGFSFKTEDIRRLVLIFVNGTGASTDNLETINKLFAPLLNISDTL